MSSSTGKTLVKGIKKTVRLEIEPDEKLLEEVESYVSRAEKVTIGPVINTSYASRKTFKNWMFTKEFLSMWKKGKE